MAKTLAEAMAHEDKLESLRRLFKANSVSGRGDSWTVEGPGDFPAVAFVFAAELLGCAPEKLFTTFDAYDEGGCETCGGSISKSLSLEIRR